MAPAIPETYRRGYVTISELSEDQVQEVLSVLKAEPPALDTSALESAIASRANIPPRQVSDLIQSLAGNYTVKVRSGYSASRLAEGALRAIDESGDDALRFSGEARDRFKDRLTKLLSVDALDAAAKANDVLYDNEHVIHSARILTDIRPVYTADPPEPPAGAVIVHMLKINYHEADGVKEFFVSLDTEDVDVLIETLERAKVKAESLKENLKAAELRYIKR